MMSGSRCRTVLQILRYLEWWYRTLQSRNLKRSIQGPAFIAELYGGEPCIICMVVMFTKITNLVQGSAGFRSKVSRESKQPPLGFMLPSELQAKTHTCHPALSLMHQHFGRSEVSTRLFDCVVTNVSSSFSFVQRFYRPTVHHQRRNRISPPLTQSWPPLLRTMLPPRQRVSSLI